MIVLGFWSPNWGEMKRLNWTTPFGSLLLVLNEVSLADEEESAAKSTSEDDAEAILVGILQMNWVIRAIMLAAL